MDNFTAVQYLEGLSEKVGANEKIAIRKAISAIRTLYSGYEIDIDEGLPITYYTVKRVDCSKRGERAEIRINGRLVFIAERVNPLAIRGRRHEMVVYDNTIDKKYVENSLIPMMRGAEVLVHDSFDLKEQEEAIKENVHKKGDNYET